MTAAKTEPSTVPSSDPDQQELCPTALVGTRQAPLRRETGQAGATLQVPCIAPGPRPGLSPPIDSKKSAKTSEPGCSWRYCVPAKPAQLSAHQRGVCSITNSNFMPGSFIQLFKSVG